jgi:endonuclease/exonuclease/phosphatase family metal-dependent hydrolase
MKLMTWNVQWCRGLDGRVDPERIVREARNVADFDVLCLQEIAVNFTGLSGSSGEDQPGRLAAGLPGYAPIFVAATDVPDAGWGRRQFGNMIFSRLPVKQVFRHLLPWPADADKASMQRALLETVVEAPFGEIRVMTTHLEYYSEEMRKAQVRAIRRLHKEAHDHSQHPRPGGEAGESIFDYWARPASAILTGDMNFKPEWKEHGMMTESFDDGTPAFYDAWQIVHAGVPNAPTVDVHEESLGEPPYCCDFIFITEDLASRVKDVAVDSGTTASDHQPMWVEVE